MTQYRITYTLEKEKIFYAKTKEEVRWKFNRIMPPEVRGIIDIEEVKK